MIGIPPIDIGPIHVDIAKINFLDYQFLLYGIALVLMMLFRPEGLFPSQRRRRELHVADDLARLGEDIDDEPGRGSLGETPGDELYGGSAEDRPMPRDEAATAMTRRSSTPRTSPSGSAASSPSTTSTSRSRDGAIVSLIGPERRRQDDVLQHHRRHLRPDRRHDRVPRRADDRPRAARLAGAAALADRRRRSSAVITAILAARRRRRGRASSSAIFITVILLLVDPGDRRRAAAARTSGS